MTLNKIVLISFGKEYSHKIWTAGSVETLILFRLILRILMMSSRQNHVTLVKRFNFFTFQQG